MKVVALAAVAMIALTSVAEAQHRDHRHGYRAPAPRHHVAPRRNWVPYAVGGLALGALGAGAYYYNRPVICWREPIYEYDRYGRSYIIAYEKICE